MRYRIIISLLTMIILGMALPTAISAETKDAGKFDLEKQMKLASLQIPFVENQGQVGDEQVKFYAQTFAGTVFVNDDGIYYNLPGGEDGGWIIKEEFAGGRAPVPVAASAPGAPVNYYLGNMEKHVSSYEEISLGEVYDRISVNLKAYGNNVEKIFTVAPGGDPATIAVTVTGIDGLGVNVQGELEVNTGWGTVKMSSPVAYQVIDDKQVYADVNYVVNGSTYGFTVGEYNRNYPLLIDPLLASTYLGGDLADSVNCNCMVLDAVGNVYIAGFTKSDTFFAVTGGYKTTIDSSGMNDVFIAKLNGDLSQLLAATYLGGSSGDSANAIIQDDSGHVYVAGTTTSQDFPVMLTPHGSGTEDSDWFVAKLDSDHLNLLTSTCFGGSSNDSVNSICFDTISPDPNNKSVFVAGNTSSSDLLVTGYQQALAGADDGLVVKLSNDLSQILSSTYLGGDNTSNLPDVIKDMVVNQDGNVYVCGIAGENFPTLGNPLKASNTGNSWSGFVSKLSNDLSGLTASTLLGSNATNAYSITLDSSGKVLVAGDTQDDEFPVTQGAYQTTRNSTDGFLIKIESDLSGDENNKPLAATFIGGTKAENAYDIALDTENNIFVAGRTKSKDYFGTSGGYQQTINGSSSTSYYDSFIAKFNDSLTELNASTYLGGSNNECAYSLALNAAGNVYVAGYTQSNNFPIEVASSQSQVAQATFGGGTNNDLFIAKLTSDLAAIAEIDTTAPIWPSGSIVVSNVTDTGINLRWEGAMDNTGVTGYQLYIYQDAGMTNLLSSTAVDITTYDVSDLQSETEYTFRVQARDTAGNWSTGGPSKTVTTTGSQADLLRPTWPADKSLTATEVTDKKLTLTWNAATDNVGVTAYNIYKGSVMLNTVSSVVYNGGTECFNYEATGLAAGNLYTFKVEAVDAAGNISNDGPSLEVTTLTLSDMIAPWWTHNDTTVLIINAVSPTQTYFEWPAASDNVGVTGYQIIQGTGQTDNGVSNPTVIATVYGTTHYTITFPDETAAYDFTLRAFDAAGNLSSCYDPVHIQPGEGYGVYLKGAYLTAITGNPLASSFGASIEDSSAVPLKSMFNMNFANNVVNNEGDAPVWPGNQQCFTLQTVAGSVYAPLNVLRIPDDTAGFAERNNIFIIPVGELASNTQYKLIISPDLMPKNKKRTMTFERDLYFTTEAAASGTAAWPSGGTLTASNPTPSGVTLNWTPATANAGVTSYAIIKDNSDIIAAVDGSTTSYIVTGLAPGNSYNFQVLAFNSYTNWCSSGPSTTAATGSDTETPNWPNASLSESNVAAHSLTLTWSAASDDGTITGYRIYQDGTKVGEVGGTTLNYNVTGLTPETSYSFKVEAGDAAGHWSSDGPSLTVSTTASTGDEIVSGVYAVNPAVDAAYTAGETADGIDTMTVNAGYSGSQTFTVNISPVTAHPGNEKAVFVQFRNNQQVNMKASTADFDTVDTASASFEVQPGDVIKVFVVDDLYITADRISTVLEE